MLGPGPVGDLSEGDWDTLISRIRKGDCTPFLGAGMSSEQIPLSDKIAEKLTRDPLYDYPLADKDDLAKVTQYIALIADPARPKELVAEIIDAAGRPDFQKLDEPHMVLARLPLPLYITTNYDDFMFEALKTSGKAPQIFVNHWNTNATESPESIEATVSEPAVYYFHGRKDDLDSMVLTEDDYLDFLVQVSEYRDFLVPPRIQEAFKNTSLLFIGYSLKDTNFRVIFRGLVGRTKARKFSVTVQLDPGQPGAAEYLTKYFDRSGLRVYWGSAREFVTKLKTRWEALG
jgi:hypothetical protein